MNPMERFDKNREFMDLAGNIVSLLKREMGREAIMDRLIQGLYETADLDDEAYRAHQDQDNATIGSDRERVDILIRQLFALDKNQAERLVSSWSNDKEITRATREHLERQLKSGYYSQL